MARRRSITLALAGLLALTAPAVSDPPAGNAGDKKPAAPAGKNADIPYVERLLAARKEYQLTLEALRKHYIQVGDLDRAKLAEEELVAYHRVTKQVFRLEFDVPHASLKGDTNIPEANKLLIEALKYKNQGWGLVGSTYLDNQRRAELLLQRLLTEYPQSTKISEAAYHLGDLYEGRAFRQVERAAAYYERCFQWDKRTQHDARIRAARLYDTQLKNQGKAAQIYQEIITHETNEAYREEAKRRLGRN